MQDKISKFVFIIKLPFNLLLNSFPTLKLYLESTKKVILNLPPKILCTPEILIEDVIVLNKSESANSEDELKKIFDWYFDWLKFAVGGGLGFCAAILLAIFASILKGEVVLNREQYFLIVLIVLSISSPCCYYLWLLSTVHRQYIHSLELLSMMKRIPKNSQFELELGIL